MHLEQYHLRPDGHYTKHYFIGSERVTSKVGNSEDYQGAITPGLGHVVRGDMEALIDKNLSDLGFDWDFQRAPASQDLGLSDINDDEETHRFFFTKDQVGSSTYISDAGGLPHQFIGYMPFGNSFTDIRTESKSTNYRFTGKEQDAETGLYYYGARYYDPNVGRFLSVDPLADKFAGWSPYNYTLNNPINMIDPDGRSPISVLAKMVAKQGVKAGIRAYAKKQIRGRMQNYMSKNMAKQFAKDLDAVLETLDNSWWETAIELVPVAGDVYGATKFGKKVAKAYDKLQELENKYIEKIYDALPASEKKKFKKNMRNAGVRDARKDQAAGVDGLGEKYEKGKGIDGHHKKDVKRHPSEMSDPRNIEFMNKKDHIKHHKENN